MSVGKAILHGTFFHFLHQHAVATGFPRIHAGPDQRFDFAHGLLRADPTKTKDERRKNAGFLRIASSHSDVAQESSLQCEKSLFPQTFELSQPFLIDRILNFLSLCNNEFESDTNFTSMPVAKGLLHRDLDGKPRKYTWKYRTSVGMLSYLQNTSRPEISMAVHQTARFSNNPMLSHEKSLLRMVVQESSTEGKQWQRLL